MAGAKTVTGVDFAFVNCKDDTVVQVNEGEDLPAGVDAAEIKRLDALDVFGDHPRVAAQRRLDEMVVAGVASYGSPETGTRAVIDDDEPSPANDFAGLQIPQLVERVRGLPGYEEAAIPDDVTRDQLVELLAEAAHSDGG